jgi:hypothetical protein
MFGKEGTIPLYFTLSLLNYTIHLGQWGWRLDFPDWPSVPLYWQAQC